MGMIDDQEIDSVFFDAGNTLLLLDYDAIANVVGSAPEPLLGAPSASAVRQAEQRARRRIDAAYGEGGGTDDGMWGRYFGYLLDELSTEPSTGWRERALARLREVHDEENLWRVAAPQASRLLGRLRDRRVTTGVISNSDGRVRRLLETAGLAPLLDGIYDSAIVGYEKPAVELFHHALGRHGAAPARSMYVGDLEHVDVHGARRSGMVPVLIDPLPRSGTEAFVTVRDLAELEALLLD